MGTPDGKTDATKRSGGEMSDLLLCALFFAMGAISVFVIACATVPVDYRKLPSFLHDKWMWLDHSETDAIPRIAVPSRRYRPVDVWSLRVFFAFFLVLSQAAQFRVSTRSGWATNPERLLEGGVELTLLVVWSAYVLKNLRGARMG